MGLEASLRYLALGDSYTIGTGASSRSHVWPSIIAARLNADLTNPAVNGYTTEDLIERELPLLAVVQPDLVTVLIGLNDPVRGRSAEHYRTNLACIYDEIAALGHPTGRDAAISIPTWSYVPAAAGFGGEKRVEELTSVFNEVARHEAAARGFTWVDLAAASTSRIGSNGWIASNGLHPGDAQYVAWAEAIWQALKDAL
ncbi:MAG: SGNH/GDSL hydrolase family protein [Candidatus Dormibacteraceae bacterium]